MPIAVSFDKFVLFFVYSLVETVELPLWRLAKQLWRDQVRTCCVFFALFERLGTALTNGLGVVSRSRERARERSESRVRIGRGGAGALLELRYTNFFSVLG